MMLAQLRPAHRGLYLVVIVVVAGLLALPGASLYYNYSGGRSCARCHEIWQPYTDWHISAHRNVSCSQCHGDVFTLNAGFHLKNIHRLYAHLHGEVPEQVRLSTRDVLQMDQRCRQCHQEAYTDWAAGSHAATYAEIFLDRNHNRQRRLMDDCLRCHGMHFEGGIRDLVTPIDATGPWRLRDPRLANQPVIPCLVCHQMHRQGNPLARLAVKPINPGAAQEIARPSLALFDRRELDYVPLARLPLPEMREGARPVRISPDRRQALCYQCHAPLATMQVASGDDRTPIGVHEGFSCLACHGGHGEKTRASCANCHPRLSNCGLDVETMDTTYKSAKSAHNVHFVKCADCHTHGVPKKKPGNAAARLSAKARTD
ncbi:MAG TPA: cytochrome c3 family protein [Terriglobia bacterium]|nr:cytochrome c3 family protein [Terriglobia bacterium]